MSAAGYAGTPLAKKLGCKPGGRLLTLGAPSRWDPGELPADCGLRALGVDEHAGAPEDVVLAFFAARAEIAAAIERLGATVFPNGAVWVAWPRRAGGHQSDVREQDIRDLALPLGLVDVKVAALGEDWSGLRLVWRRERRRA